jgi:hypothetical protein
MERAVDGAIRLGRDWKALSRERRTAAIAAAVLWVTLFLPWYQASVVSRSSKTRGAIPVGESLSGWAAFSAVEALIVILSLGIVLLLFLRAEGRVAHAPGRDGWTITVAGAISVFLVILGLFNAPSPASRGQYVLSTGLEWGIFLALLAAIALTWAGGRIRRSVADDPFLARGRRSEAEPAADFSEPASEPGPVKAPPEPVANRAGAPPPEPHTEATKLGVVEPLTDETSAAAVATPTAETKPGMAAPPTDETRAGSVEPLTAAGAKASPPAAASEPSVPDTAAPAAPAPRSAWRPAERPAWSDPERPVGWLTAPPKARKEDAEAEAPPSDARPEKPEQLTIPLEHDE